MCVMLCAGMHDLRCVDAAGELAALVKVHVLAGLAVSCQLVPGTALVGTPLLAAQWIVFELEACDRLGNGLASPAATQRDAPLPTVTSSACVPSHPPTVTPIRGRVDAEGRPAVAWEVQMMPAVAGSHPLHVSVGRTPAVGSPYTIDVRPGVVHAGRCTASGDGAHTTLPFRPTSFSLEARDAFGNVCSRGGHSFSVSIAPRAHGHYGAVSDTIPHVPKSPLNGTEVTCTQRRRSSPRPHNPV